MKRLSTIFIAISISFSLIAPVQETQAFFSISKWFASLFKREEKPKVRVVPEYSIPLLLQNKNCGNGICEEKERANPKSCPEDCATNNENNTSVISDSPLEIIPIKTDNVSHTNDKEIPVLSEVHDVLTNELITINYNGVKVEAIVDAPKTDKVDVLLVYHGTAMEDSKIVEAAQRMLTNTRKILKRDNIMIISVAYPEEGLLMGDNIKEAEAALLWVKNKAAKALGVEINKIYLMGHSQGGYLVTRLNTMHKTDGVIANGAGPIDLAFRCRLSEVGTIKNDEKNAVCDVLKKEYGSMFKNPTPYTKRSMINFTFGHKSKILFIQGMEDGKVQLKLWPNFKAKMSTCRNCSAYKILEIEGVGHQAVFESQKAINAVNTFLSN